MQGIEKFSEDGKSTPRRPLVGAHVRTPRALLSCPRHCPHRGRPIGFLFPFAKSGRKLYSLGYRFTGCPAKFDPIEKKPLNMFFPGTRVFSSHGSCNYEDCFFARIGTSRNRNPIQVRFDTHPAETSSLAIPQRGCPSSPTPLPLVTPPPCDLQRSYPPPPTGHPCDCVPCMSTSMTSGHAAGKQAYLHP